MRPETLAPSHVVLDLLARADDLATVAKAAIEAGDDSLLADVLDAREAVIDAIVRTWHGAAHQTSPQHLAMVTQATLASMALGVAARDTAIIARDEVVAALAALDARQLASHEYRSGTPHVTIDVVL